MTRSIWPVLAGAAVLAALLLAGCVGFSRQEPRELFPADSLSRELAQATPRDPLQVLRHIDHIADGDSTWQYIASLRFREDGHLVATDVGRSRSYVIGPDGVHVHTMRHPGVQFPYLLHAAHDTLVVHDAGAGLVAWFINGQFSRHINVPVSTSREALTVFAALTPSGLFAKKTTDPGPATLLHYDAVSGQLLSTVPLEGPTWNFRGPMMPWGDALLSVSAFRPHLHRISRDLEVDTLQLIGFDSPALNRTRLFLLGKRKDPPLLVPAIAGAGDHLFVLNVRPDQVRIDVYDPAGRLTRILEDDTADESGVNTVGLAAFAGPDGSVTLAVARVAAEYNLLSLRYRPRISLYRWNGAR